MRQEINRNECVRSDIGIACCHAIPGGMIEPGMVVVGCMGRVAGQQSQLMVEQNKRQRQRQRQIGEQRSDRQDAMKVRLYHNLITAFPYAPRACDRRGNTF